MYNVIVTEDYFNYNTDTYVYSFDIDKVRILRVHARLKYILKFVI